MPAIKFNEAVSKNQQHSCSVPGCERMRQGVSLHCEYHRKKRQRLGSATASPMVGLGGKRHYRAEYDYSRQLITKNQDTKPVQAAVKLLRQWVNGCRGGCDLPGKKLMSMIELDGKELEILSELCGVYIFALDVKHVEQQELIYALANAVFRFVPVSYPSWISKNGKKCKKPSIRMGSLDRQAIGKHVLDEVGLLLENVRQHMASPEQQHTNLKKQLMESL